MHRDLKPENFLFLEKGVAIEKSTLKLIDFGLSTPFEPGQKCSTKGFLRILYRTKNALAIMYRVPRDRLPSILLPSDDA